MVRATGIAPVGGQERGILATIPSERASVVQGESFATVSANSTFTS